MSAHAMQGLQSMETVNHATPSTIVQRSTEAAPTAACMLALERTIARATPATALALMQKHATRSTAAEPIMEDVIRIA